MHEHPFKIKINNFFVGAPAEKPFNPVKRKQKTQE
jgi:hypothetical protein